jgi:Na+/melibiose symporter-like transporter
MEAQSALLGQPSGNDMTHTPADPPPAELATWRMGIYGLVILPISFLYVPLSLMIPAFYAEHLGLSLTVIGQVLFFARLLDMAVDPFLGRLTDATRTRWGRRRPWLAVGAPIVMAGTALVFLPPENPSGLYLMAGCMMIYFGASMHGLAYAAWGAEVVHTYHGRSRLAGFRHGAGLLGVLLSASVPAVASLYGHGIDRFTIAVSGIAVIIALPLTVIAALRFVPDPPGNLPQTAEVPMRRAVVEAWRNRPFRIACAALTSLSVGTGIANACLVFFISNYVGAPEMIGPIIFASTISVLISIPVWIRISRRIGKHRSVALSLALALTCGGIGVSLLGPGDGWLVFALLVANGALSGGFYVLPVGIIGDIIDYDALKAGRQRSGLYFGIMALANQAAPAIAIGAVLPLLDSFGFHPSGTNTAAALDALRMMFCFAPLPFIALAAVLMYFFPIDARRHGIVRRRLDGRVPARGPTG